MRRLTLILSDLYLPADAVREAFPTTLELPALQWLLRFAQPTQRISDWRSWLSRELGAAAIVDWPVAHVAALYAQVPVEGTWIATPVALEARLDHVRLRDRGLLRLPVEQQQALQIEFREVFGDGMYLRGGCSPSFALDGGPTVEIQTQDPARLLDSDIGKALPSGPAAGELRRLGAEFEMWLHSSPVNDAREKARQPRIASLWLWGGGAARAKPPGFEFEDRLFRLHGSDGHVAALQDLLGTEMPAPAPASFEERAMDRPTFIELAPMSGMSSETLPEVERNWFVPIRDALCRGALDSFRLVANDRVFETLPRARWKFWRRRRTWLESLA